MSLFENEEYRWRDTYFVLFHSKDRPKVDEARKALETLGPRYRVQNVRGDQQQRFESLTLLSPDDFAAMDISYVCGEEVEEQVEKLSQELGGGSLTPDEQRKWNALKEFDSRYDIYHFEQVVVPTEEDDEGFLDPGALLIVLERLARLCQGVGIDPQTGTVV